MPSTSRSTLKSRLPEIAAQLDPKVKAATYKGAKLVEAGAQAGVEVRTGALRAAIHVEEVPGGYSVVAGNREVYWGHFLEFGTSHSAAEPFLIPALEGNRDNITRLIGEALRDL